MKRVSKIEVGGRVKGEEEAKEERREKIIKRKMGRKIRKR